MSLRKYPVLLRFFDQVLSNADPEQEEVIVSGYKESAAPDQLKILQTDIGQLISLEVLPLDDFGSEANRWFADQDEARAWLNQLSKFLRDTSQSASDDSSGNSVVVKDSNGTVLLDGDTVQVIKDLKVRGGTSDLKRGTTLRKIRLIGDSENIECKVDGSVLVLKTQFLKKS